MFQKMTTPGNGTETQYSAGDTATINLNTLTSATFWGTFISYE